MKINAKGEINDATRKDAFSFFKSIDCFDFILNLVLCYRVLELSLLVTQLLQTEMNDIAAGIHMINSLIQHVWEIRQNVDDYHNEWYQFALRLANRFNIKASKPRTNKRQIFRDNHPAETVSDFYRVSLTLPLLDTLYQELNARFSENSLLAYKGLYLLPNRVVKEQGKKPLSDLVQGFFSFYFDDMPHPFHIKAEIELWEKYWSTIDTDLPYNISDTLKVIDHIGFPNIKTALKILATIPITSCSCERSFSDMKLIKSSLRNRMSQERLNGLCLMNVHLDKIPDSMTVCERFLAKGPNRRIAT